MTTEQTMTIPNRFVAGEPLVNRETGKIPADGWYMVAHKGDHPVMVKDTDGNLTRLIQRIDEQAVNAMVNRFAMDKAANISFEMLVDRDHFASRTELPSEAYGWLTALENRQGNLFGQIRWTDIGEQAVLNRRYRFLSPEWFPRDCEVVGEGIIRPLRLDRVSVTNGNNIRNNAPLVNRNNAPAGQGKESTMDYKAKLLALLGVAADATDEQIVTAEAAIVNRLKVDVAAIENRATTAEGKVAEFEKIALGARVEKTLTDFAGVIQNRDAMKASLLADYDKGLVILQALKPVAATDAGANGLIMNRDAGQQPDVKIGTGNADAEATRAKDQEAFVQELRIANRCSYVDATLQAMVLKPELFQRK